MSWCEKNNAIMDIRLRPLCSAAISWVSVSIYRRQVKSVLPSGESLWALHPIYVACAITGKYDVIRETGSTSGAKFTKYLTIHRKIIVSLS